MPAAFVRVREADARSPTTVNPVDPETRNAKVRNDDDPSTTTSTMSTTSTTLTTDGYFDYFHDVDYGTTTLDTSTTSTTSAANPKIPRSDV